MDREKRLEKVAELWVKGLQIDWNKLYGEYTPRRISLPAYPFAEEYYWLPTQEGEPETIATAMPQFELMPKRCFLRKQWQPCPIEPAEMTNQTVAILANEETMALAEELSAYFSTYRIFDSQELDRVSAADYEHVAGAIDLIGCGTSHEHSMGWINWLQKLIEQGRASKHH